MSNSAPRKAATGNGDGTDISNLSSLSRASSHFAKINRELGPRVSGLTHMQTCLSDWITYISSAYPQDVKTIKLVLAIKQELEPNLILLYSIGCLQDRDFLIDHATHKVLEDSASYALQTWGNPVAPGFMNPEPGPSEKQHASFPPSAHH